MLKKFAALAACAAIAASCSSCGKKSSSSEASPSNKLIGKWAMTDETLQDMVGEDQEKPLEGFLVFNEDDSLEFSVTSDASNYAALYDDGFAIDDAKLDIVSFNGELLNIGSEGQTIFTLKRSEKSDDMYGEYIAVGENDEPVDADTQTIFLFESSGRSKITEKMTGSYDYDEDKNEIVIKLGDDDTSDSPSKVEIDGDALSVLDPQGAASKFTRVK